MNASQTPPALTVVIPFYNRANTVAFTLESLARARGSLELETILVDDGSTPAAIDQLRGAPHQPTCILRQENQGLLFARLAGLAAATGKYVLFLDSDDLVSADKLRTHVEAMNAAQADVSYSDTARQNLDAVRGTLDMCLYPISRFLPPPTLHNFSSRSSRPRTARSSPPTTSALASQPRHSLLPSLQRRGGNLVLSCLRTFPCSCSQGF